MIILGIEFFALIVICYLFLVFVTRDRVSEGKKRSIPIWAVGAMILFVFAMLLFASWYGRLELAP